MKFSIAAILFITILSSSLFAIIQRKKAKASSGNCEIWIGTGNGNDPAMKLELTLCYKKNEVTGFAYWVSELGGSCKTKLKGYKENSNLILQDEHFIENKPKSGWEFCLAEEYRISISNNRLEGTYSSKACRDYGNFSLVKN